MIRSVVVELRRNQPEIFSFGLPLSGTRRQDFVSLDGGLGLGRQFAPLTGVVMPTQSEGGRLGFAKRKGCSWERRGWCSGWLGWVPYDARRFRQAKASRLTAPMATRAIDDASGTALRAEDAP